MNAIATGLRWDMVGPEGMNVLMVAFEAGGSEASRLAKSLRHAGCIVAALCPDLHALAATPFLHARYKLEAARQSRAIGSRLAEVMVRFRPRLVLPCDARALVYLQALAGDWLAGAKSALDGEAMETLLASLGDPSAFAAATDRAHMLAMARECGVRTPATVVVASPAHADEAAVVLGLPVHVLGAASRPGDEPVQCNEAAGVWAAAARLSNRSRERSLAARARRLIFGRDGGREAPIVVRAKIDGEALSYSVAALSGVVLSGFATRTLVSEARGAISVEANTSLARAADRLVRRMGASGILRLDFVVEAVTGDVYLLDCGAWPDAVAPLGEIAGVDLGVALACGLRGEMPWRRTPDQPVVVDVLAPALVREAAQRPWLRPGFAVPM